MKTLDALIVLTRGWKTEDEKELCALALETLLTEKEKIVLQYRKEKAERELFELEEQLDVPGVMRYQNRKMAEISDEEIRQAAHNWATSKTTRSTDYWKALVDAYISGANCIKDKK